MAQPFPEAECRDSIYEFMENHVRLHDMWRNGLTEEAAAKMPFHARPKLHMTQHLVEDKLPLFESPMYFRCYCDEDYMGVIKAVCAMSKHPATLEARVGEKAMIMAGVSVYEWEADA